MNIVNIGVLPNWCSSNSLKLREKISIIFWWSGGYPLEFDSKSLFLEILYNWDIDHGER